MNAETLATYAGIYEFRPSVSARDKQVRSYGQIGVDIGIEDDAVVVAYVGDASPAAMAGMLTVDVITQIEGVLARGLSIAEVVTKLRGPVNSRLRPHDHEQRRRPRIEVIVARALIPLAGAALQVRFEEGKLLIDATGKWPVLDFDTST